MQDMPRVTFLVLMDVFVIGMLVMLLNGCGGKPLRFQDHPHGDFVSHMASAADPAPATANDQRVG